MKPLLTTVCLVFATISAFAQIQPHDTTHVNTKRTVALWGHVYDSFTRKGIADAQITFLRTDSTLRGTATTQQYGSDAYYRVDIPAEPQKIIIKASHPDYEDCFVEIDIKHIARNTYFDAPWHYMKRRLKHTPVQGDSLSVNELEEVTIRASKIQMVWKGDTIQFNADAFNVAEGSMLDVLIRQLPGVKLSDDGEITVNGKRVDNLMLNGTEFFKGNNKVMLDNLPYYVVQDIQVYDKQTELSEYLGFDAEKKEYVMNVRLKRQYNTGYTANAEFSRGTHDRYLGRLFGLRYTNQSRLSLFGNWNNMNERRRPGSDGDWSPTDEPEGIKKIQQIGGNLNITDKDRRWKETADFTLARQRSDDDRRMASTGFFPTTTVQDGSQNSLTLYSRSVNKYASERLNVSANNSFTLLKPLRLEINTGINYSNSLQDSWQRGVSFHKDPTPMGSTLEVVDSVFNAQHSMFNAQSIGLVSRQGTMSYSDYNSISLNQSANLTKKLLWGDDIKLRLSANYNKNDGDGLGFIHTDMYSNDNNQRDYRENYAHLQYRYYNLSAHAEYEFNFLSGWHFLTYYNFQQEYRYDNHPSYRLDRYAEWTLYKGDYSRAFMQNTLDNLPPLDESLFDMGVSSCISTWSKRHRVAPRLYFSKDNEKQYVWFNVHSPFDMKHERIHFRRNGVDTVVTRNNFSWLPDMTFIYKDKVRHDEYTVTMSRSTDTPNMEDLVGYRDDNDPLYVYIGNPELKTSATHQARVAYKHGVPAYQQHLSLTLSGRYTTNSLSNATSYNPETGVYTIQERNISGNWYAGASVNFTRTLDSLKRWRIDNNLHYNYQHIVSYCGTTSLSSPVKAVSHRSALYENLFINYRMNEKFDISLLGGINCEWVKSPLQNYNNTHTADFKYGMNFRCQLPLEFSLATDLTMYHRRGYADDNLNTNDLIWNAQIAKSFLKGRLTTKLVGYDILQHMHSTWSWYYATSHSSIWYNTIPSYVLLSVAWKWSRAPKVK